MISSLPVTGYVLWLHPHSGEPGKAPYSATCFIDIDAEGIPWIRAMSGQKFYPRYIPEIADWFIAHGYKLVKAERVGLTLPGAVRVDDHWEWDIPELLQRLVERRNHNPNQHVI